MSEVKPSQNIAQFIELLKSRDFNYSPSANPTPIVSIISSFSMNINILKKLINV